MGDERVNLTRLVRGGRITAKRKSEAVIRLLRGEDLELVSRDLGVTAAQVREEQLASMPRAA